MLRPGEALPGRSSRVALASLLLVHVSLAIAYQRAVPLFEAPDEPSHIQYVAFLSQEGRLPRFLGSRDVQGEGMQPPLYYVLLQPLFARISTYDPELLVDLDQANRWIYRLADLRVVPAGARIRMLGTTQGPGRVFAVDPSLDYLRALRWGSLAFGALAVILTFDAARRVSRSLPFTVLCTSLLAFSPQFLFVSSYVNNDVACAALGAAGLWLFAFAVERGRSWRGLYLAAAALFAVGFATKHSALPALAVTAVTLFVLDGRPLRQRMRDAAPGAGFAVALMLPLLWQNLQRFGAPFGVDAVMNSADSLEGLAKYGGRFAYLLHVYGLVTFRTYWATFGWLNVEAPEWIYFAFFALTAAGVLGFALGARAEPRALRLYVLATALATLASHLWVNWQAVAPQGRHLFGAAPHIAVLLALGISRLAGRRPLGVGWRSAGAVSAGMLALSAYCVARVLVPAYG